jgi:hypothetical protein
MNAVPLPPHIANAFRKQEKSCLALGSPFTARLCALVADEGVPPGPVHDRLAGWSGRPDSAGDALPLRLTGALHNLVLGKRDTALADAYPPNDVSDTSVRAAVLGAISRHGDFIDGFLDNAPQTNETARSAVLLPAFLHLQARFGMPFVLSELGSSAGLNQNWHRYRYEFGGWGWGSLDSPVTLACEVRGDALPVPAPVSVRNSAGCDIAPIPVDGEQERLRLESYVWPDQPARLDRLRGALCVAASHPPAVETAAASDWLEKRLAERYPGRLHTVFHTIMWQYMPDGEQARTQALIKDAGATATADAPFAWLRFETDGKPDGAPIVVTTWTGGETAGETVTLGRGDFHGRWVDWAPAA